MTEKQQRRLYFPAWGKCAAANDWRMQKGRLVADLAQQREEVLAWDEPARTAMLNVLDYAEQLAMQEHRAVTADDLRHGCNLVATAGRKSGSGDLRNREVNRVVALFRLLHEPGDLDCIMAWLNPEESDRKSLASFIRRLAPEATLTAIARNAFGTIFWEDLDAQKLRWLLGQVKKRAEKWRGRARPTAELVQGPF